MKNIKFIYFDGCPNAQKVMNILIDLRVEFEKIEQIWLPDGDELKNYSSPTITLNNQIVFGSVADGGGCSLNLPTLEFLKERLCQN